MFDSQQVLHDGVQIIFSTADDGSMAAGGGAKSDPQHQANADEFLVKYGFPTERYRVLVRYGDNDYTDVERITSDTPYGDIACDALYTTEPGRVITLPVADCIATVVYDPVADMLGVLHLGRHSSVAGLIESFAIEVADNVGSDPRDWLVWMSPSLRQDNDRLEYFTPPDTDEWRDYIHQHSDGSVYIDTAGHNRARFERAGVEPANIAISPIDTYSDERFFSHRAANQLQNPARQGRMMVAAAISRRA